MSEFYSAWSKRKEILDNSSSGGIFGELAEWMIKGNGVVVGAYQDQNTYELKHIMIERLEDISKLQRSKYYQSEAYVTFEGIRDLLKQGRKVMFSGTACQVAALYAVLEEETKDNLFTVDMLCHGVPSKRTFQSYVKSQEKKYKKKIEQIYFRTKLIPWENGGGTSMEIHFKDGSIKLIEDCEDEYYMAFKNNLILRESCYVCKYAGIKRISDITLADYWGINRKKIPEAAMKNGVSLVLVNTDKGRAIWSKVTERNVLEYASASPDSAVPHNRPLSKPYKRNPKRDLYLAKQDSKDFNKLVRQLLRKEYIKEKIKKVIGLDRIREIKKIMKGNR